MANNARKHVIPAGGDVSVTRATIFETFGNTIHDVVPVANAVEAAQVVSDLTTQGVGPSATNPLVVARADARGLHRIEYTYDGTVWLPASGMLSFANDAARDSWTTSNSALLSIGDRCISNGSECVWVGSWARFSLATGPGAQTDYGTTETQVCTITMSVTSGVRYKVSAQVAGSQVTNTGTLIARIRTGATVGSGSSGTDAARPVTGLPVAAGVAASGFASYVYTATSTGTVSFALTIVSTANAFRVTANQCQLWVDPIV